MTNWHQPRSNERRRTLSTARDLQSGRLIPAQSFDRSAYLHGGQAHESGDTSQNTAKPFASQWLSARCNRKLGTDRTRLPAKFSVEISECSQVEISSIRSSFYRTVGKGNPFGENSSVGRKLVAAGVRKTLTKIVERMERESSRSSL